MTILPAYGRDYKSAAAVKADWAAGKDFQSALGYLSIRDLPNIPVPPTGLWARYDRSRKTVRVA